MGTLQTLLKYAGFSDYLANKLTEPKFTHAGQRSWLDSQPDKYNTQKIPT